MLLCNLFEDLGGPRERHALVVCAVTDIATPRAERSERRQGLMETVSPWSRDPGDHELAVARTLRVGADVPGRGCSGDPGSHFRGSTV
jgi:hypothetical protein